MQNYAATPLTREQVTGVILAGGRGQRLGGVDKGLLNFAGQPLLEWVLAGLTPQVGNVVISANRHLARYASYGYPVLPDQFPDYPGPLAGVAAALATASTPWLLTLPCDSPWVHPQLRARLDDQRRAVGADLAVAHDGTHLQPLHALLPQTLATSLTAYLNSGGRTPRQWFMQQRLAITDFTDDPAAFANLNTAAEWQMWLMKISQYKTADLTILHP